MSTVNEQIGIIEEKEKFDYSLLVDTTILAGEIMLKNGAETNRIENTMDKLLKTTNMKHIEAVVMTTSIIVTLSDPSIEHITAVKRIYEITTNLNRVNMASSLVESYCNHEISLEELFHELKKVKKLNQYNNLLKAISLILIPPSFTIMLNGTYLDAISAILCGVVLVLLDYLFEHIQTNDFMKNTFIIMIVTFVSGLLNKLIGSNIESVIIGVMMPFVPGIAITNAARDTLNTDYMSGSAKLFSALIQAFAVALGVFVGIFINNRLLGGI